MKLDVRIFVMAADGSREVNGHQANGLLLETGMDSLPVFARCGGLALPLSLFFFF